MYKLKSNKISASEIAKYLNSHYLGEDIIVNRPADFRNLPEYALCYCDNQKTDEIAQISNKVIIITKADNLPQKDNLTYVISKNPQKDFYRIVNEFFMQGIIHHVDSSAVVKTGARIGMNVNIGKNCLIDENVSIGNNSYIGNNVIVLGTVVIGADCIIKDGAVLGSEGFAFIEDEEEIIHIPQFGRVVIGNQVWIGANTSIERPFLGTTFVESNTKIDDLCHIGQGVFIGEGSQITAGCILARFASIGKNCFLGVGTAVKENVVIGANCVIGMGSIVVTELEGNAKYMGVPAKQWVEQY